MSKRNCPNCGAPTTPNDKCEYCGTYFFDLAHIPLREPFYLSINVGTKDKPSVVTRKVYTNGCRVTLEPLWSENCGRTIDGQMQRIFVRDTAKYEFEFVTY